LDDLENRVAGGDTDAWAAYLDTARVLAALLAHVPPERRDALLTTAEMAARLNVTPKTLLRRKARGDVRPVLQRGKLIRWRGDEAVR
jgi:hypothetical protein